jgi:hypothetical protein
VGKQEFDNNIQSIKSALKFHMPEECSENGESLFNDIRAFVTHTPKKQKQECVEIKQVYKERASGNIEVNIKEPKLRELVMSIQEIIKAKNES